MSKTSITIFTSIALGCLIFLLSPGPGHFIHNPTSWELREQLVYLTGVCSITLMAVSMLLSIRLSRVSGWMRGLDKSYVVHKWTGIFSTITVVSHFLMEKVPHLLVESGFVKNPGELTDSGNYAEWEVMLFETGVALAEPVFYAMMFLIVIALFKKIPYHWFRKSHRIFPAIFLLAAYHGATAQLKERWIGSPGSFLLFLILIIGSGAAIVALTGTIGKKRKAKALVHNFGLRDGNIFELELAVEKNSTIIYHPGQYAFLKFEHSKEPHPFSFAAYDETGKKLRFAIKLSGDFTSQLPSLLRHGQVVQVEGPYGEFLFNDRCERQIWIAGGIGVTPFLSRLEYLSLYKQQKPVDFFYSTRSDRTTLFPASIEEACALAGVQFYHFNSSQKEYLTVELLRSKIGDLTNVSIWFCGPKVFADCMMKGLKSTGFEMHNFHYDSFEMR